MTWSDTPIDGQQSVANNKTPINNAFTYTSTSMKVDHYWDNANSNLDGHHQFVQMDKLGGATPANPTIGTDMNGVYFCKDKTATEAPALQTTEPFYMSYDGTRNQILQMGFRAMVSFTGRATNGAATLTYIHNVASVTRTAEGTYTVTFTTVLPSDDYIVLVGGIRNDSSSNRILAASVKSSVAQNTVQTTALVKVIFGRANASSPELG